MPPVADSAANDEHKPTEATLKFPFESSARAELVYSVLNVDKEPRRNFVQKELRVVGDTLEVHFTADQVKNLRTAITSFFESLLLCTDTIKEFAPHSTTSDNAGAHASTVTA